MKCPIDPFTLSLVHDGEVNVFRALMVRRHVARCDRCRAALEALERVDDTVCSPDLGLAFDGTWIPPETCGGEVAASAMPGRRRLAEAEHVISARRRRRGLAVAAVVVVLGGAAWWAADVPARTDRALFRMSDENRRVSHEMLEHMQAMESRLVELEMRLLAGDLDREERATFNSAIVELRNLLVRSRAAARHASGGPDAIGAGR